MYVHAVQNIDIKCFSKALSLILNACFDNQFKLLVFCITFSFLPLSYLLEETEY